jgi:hypothetical protein
MSYTKLHEEDFSGGGGIFYKFEKGENTIRIIEGFYKHTVYFPNGGSSEKYACWVIDRRDGEIRKADLGRMIMKALKRKAESSLYGFEGNLPPYDIIVTKTGSSGLDTEYTIDAMQPTELTKEEKEKIEKLEEIGMFVERMKEAAQAKKFGGTVVNTKEQAIQAVNDQADTEKEVNVDRIPF